MGGMCLGSLLLPRCISPRDIRCGSTRCSRSASPSAACRSSSALPLVGQVYVAIGGAGSVGLADRAACSARICLLPPTLLDGRHAAGGCALGRDDAARRVAGSDSSTAATSPAPCSAACSPASICCASYDMRSATLRRGRHQSSPSSRSAFALRARRRTRSALPSIDRDLRRRRRRSARGRIVAIALSGLTALGAEVIWTRLLSLLLGATVYTFSLILAAFLVGLGIGSSIGSVVGATRRDPRRALGWCQLAADARRLPGRAYSLTESLPLLAGQSVLASTPWFAVPARLRALPLGRCCPRRSSGARAFRSRSPPSRRATSDPARLVGRVYAANTVGGIVGVAGRQLVLIAWIGTQQAQRMLIVVAALAGLLLLGPTRRPAAAQPTRGAR